jgi:tRNA threonylcarbamoyladenosine biosynthesis protein TsaB
VIILALDVTSPFGSLVIRRDGSNLAERTLESQDGFAHVLYPAIADLLRDAGVKLSDVDCFASANGPGAFTGVRVGLTAIKGLAEASGRPVAGVSNLRALSLFGKSPYKAVMLDARRGDIFGAVYGPDSELVGEESVTKLEPWLSTLPPQLHEFIVQDPKLLTGRNDDGRDLTIVEAPRFLATAIAQCAELDGRTGRWVDPAALDANYVRRSDAEFFWKET